MAEALVVSTSAAGAQRLRIALEGLGAQAIVLAPSGADAATRERDVLVTVTDAAPAILVLGPGLEADEALALAARVERAAPGVRVLVAVAPTAERWRDAARVGVRDLIDPELDAAALQALLHEHVRAARATRSLSATETPSGRLVTVVSPKGGSGKTMVASALAVAFARGGEDTVLVDLDLQFGDVATGLGLRPEHTMLDVTKSAAGLDATTVKVFLTPHDSGLFVLAAPTNPADGERIDTGSVGVVLDILRRSFTTVVVDTGAGVDEHALAAIERSSDLVAVCSLDVASVMGLAKELDILERLGLDRATTHVVLNREDRGVGITPEDVERILRRGLDVRIEASRRVAAAANQGLPIVDLAPRSGPARAIVGLAHRIAGEAHGGRRGTGRARR